MRACADDTDGKEYIDWTSQTICTNLGYSVPPAVVQAVTEQLERLPHVYGGMGMVEIRCRLAKLMAEIMPGDINGFLFPSGGAEANEVAVRLARRYTGRKKIINLYRSYHGGTGSALTATGDFRRWYAEDGIGGFVKAFNPTPFNFSWGGASAYRKFLAPPFSSGVLCCVSKRVFAAVDLLLLYICLRPC